MRNWAYMALLLALVSVDARAQTTAPAGAPPATPATPPPLPWPQAMVMPWRIVAIDVEAHTRARPALDAARAALSDTALAAKQPLSALLTRAPLTINAKRVTDAIDTGAPKNAQQTKQLAIEPSWCALLDRYLVFVTVADAATNRLLGSAHATFPRADWERMSKAKSLQGPLTASIRALATEALSQAAPRADDTPFSAKQDTLHLGLDGGRANSHCLGLLLEEKLAQDFTVVRNLGLDRLATARDRLGQPVKLRRPTRRATIVWHNNPEGKGLTQTFPRPLALSARFADGTMGYQLPPTYNGTWTFKADGNRIAFDVDPAFRQLLDDQKKTLLTSDWPQIAKIDRAWVYLDRGRAWGLKMGDRVTIAAEGGEVIKGHVVKFFGPMAKVVSPRGFPVAEGAIVFVRKNQKLTKVGQELRMDPRSYPTPYPITPGTP